jgi:hypothetical protein
VEADSVAVMVGDVFDCHAVAAVLAVAVVTVISVVLGSML